VSEDITKQVILVVDDAPENIQVLSAILKNNYKVKIATNGEKALKIANSDNPPDLILLDIIMPEMDGYEVCKQLKENQTTKDIPVIFVTGVTEKSEQEKGMALGALGYLNKPVDPDEVLQAVRKYIG
jgi:putative two-component system response regulator